MSYEFFPFGKYAGHEIAEIPTTYLIYALENFTLPEELNEAMRFEVFERIGINPSEYVGNLKKVYKQMCKKYHPDKGGTNEQMAVVNDFYHAIVEGGMV
jgi:uncharacterized protein (DUF3820 family)